MKNKKVICNKADHPLCSECNHSIPHDREVSYCSEWGDCFGEDGKELFKVRCVDVNSEKGKNVIKNKNNDDMGYYCIIEVNDNFSLKLDDVDFSNPIIRIYSHNKKNLIQAIYYGKIIKPKKPKYIENAEKMLNCLHDDLIKKEHGVRYGALWKYEFRRIDKMDYDLIL